MKYAADLCQHGFPRVRVDWSRTTSFDEDTTACWPISSNSTTSGWPSSTSSPRADGGSVRKKNTRGLETAIACRHLPARAGRERRADHARRRAGLGWLRWVSNADRERRLEFTPRAASRVPRRGHPDGTGNCLAHTGNHAPGLGQDPELTARLACRQHRSTSAVIRDMPTGRNDGARNAARRPVHRP